MKTALFLIYAGVTSAVLSLPAGPASAAGECPYLTRPLVETEGGTTRMNRWVNGTKLCHDGRSHVCTDGTWKLYEPCSEAEPRWHDSMAWRLEGGKPGGSASAGSGSMAAPGGGAGGQAPAAGGSTGGQGRATGQLAGRWCHPGKPDKNWIEIRGNEVTRSFETTSGGTGSRKHTGSNSGGEFVYSGKNVIGSPYTTRITLLPDGDVRDTQSFEKGSTFATRFKRCN